MARYIMHSDEESKSKYKGGFINGKNTSAYNHDYYIHNKEKWNKVATKIKGIFERAGRQYHALEGSLYRLLSVNQNGEKPERVELDEVSGASAGMTVKTKTPEHKYLYRVTINGKRRYFYTEAEYYSFLSKTKKKQGSYSMEDDCSAINEDYPSDGYVRNCPSCALAYDMRRRGYDVKSTSLSNGMPSKEIKKFWKNAEYKTVKGSSTDYVGSSQKVVNELADYGEGARGTLTASWKTGGSHIINWENIDGQTYIIDAQSNQILPGWKFSRSVAQKVDFEKGVEYLRTDNLELTEYIVDTKLFKEHD